MNDAEEMYDFLSDEIKDEKGVTHGGREANKFVEAHELGINWM